MGMSDQITAVRQRQGSDPVEADLLSAAVASYDSLVSSPGVNGIAYVVLATGTEAFHKPLTGVDEDVAESYGHDSWEPTLHECAAWRLAAALGAPYSTLVPPCVLRAIHGELGSVAQRVPGGFAAIDTLVSAHADQVSAAALFDALVGQQDRHPGNFRYDPQTGRLGLIDHGYAFAVPGDYCNWSTFVSWRHSDSARLTSAEHATLARLLDSPDLLDVAPVLAADRAEALAGRADRMRRSGVILTPGDY